MSLRVKSIFKTVSITHTHVHTEEEKQREGERDKSIIENSIEESTGIWILAMICVNIPLGNHLPKV